MSNADIIDHHDLAFDPGDPLNGSLYICRPLGEPRAQHCDPLIAELQAAGLWSDAQVKEVPDDHRGAYKQQLSFVEHVRYDIDGSEISIARFDHEKFPSDAKRWIQWKDAIDGRLKRI
ncbi:MAG: hypothetical protein ACI8XZ_005272 [Gammaproteobacteria bacterium]|jgi:hypothetical protein